MNGMLFRGTHGSRVLVVALTVAALASCSTHVPEAQGEPELPTPLPQVDMSTFALPLEAYWTTVAESRAVYAARNILLVRCMGGFGFTLVPPEAMEPEPDGPNVRRYLAWDEARAEAYGYKWPEITNRQRPAEPILGAAAEAAMTGEGPSMIGGQKVPDDGCIGEATRILGVDQGPNSGMALVQRLGNEAYHRMNRDSRVVAAVKRWSQCMERAGYHYPDPARANNDPAFATDVASKAEISTAMADVKCKKEENLISVMAAVETAYQNRLIDQNQQQLRLYQDQLRAQVVTAARVIAGGR